MKEDSAFASGKQSISVLEIHHTKKNVSSEISCLKAPPPPPPTYRFLRLVGFSVGVI